MNSVVVFENRHSKDEKLVLKLQYLEHADGSVSVSGYINDVIFRQQFDPDASEHPKERYMSCGITSNQRNPLVELIFWVSVSNYHLLN